MARWLAREGWRGDVVLCSAAQRTRETLELMGGALDAPTISIEKELYLASADALLRRLRRLERAHRAAAIIAHNPGLEDLARAFTTFAGDAEPIGKFPTAAIAWFVADIEEWRELSPNRTKLRAFATPASIADDET